MEINLYLSICKKRNGAKNIGNDVVRAVITPIKANPDTNASGTVIEAKLDKGRGPVATLLVQRDTCRYWR